MPKTYPPFSTVYRRFHQWEKQDLFVQIRNSCLEVFYSQESALQVSFIDATFVRGCLGMDKIGGIKCGKGSKIMAIVDQKSRPLVRIVASAPHDQMLKKKYIKLVAHHKKNRKKEATQNRQELKKVYKERLRVERLFVWIKFARRLLNRFEKLSFVFQVFFDIFSTLVLVKDL